MARIFLAIDPPRPLLEDVDKRRRRWMSSRARVAWVSASKMHLTLKFLGEIPEAALPGIVTSCQEISSRHEAFRLSLQKTGLFPDPRRPRILWVGFGGDLAALGRLQKDLEEAMETLGFPREDRPFSPHLTVGRVRDTGNLAPLIDTFLKEDIGSPFFLAEELVVYQSHLTPEGPIYKALARCSLKSPAIFLSESTQEITKSDDKKKSTP